MQCSSGHALIPLGSAYSNLKGNKPLLKIRYNPGTPLTPHSNPYVSFIHALQDLQMFILLYYTYCQ